MPWEKLSQLLWKHQGMKTQIIIFVITVVSLSQVSKVRKYYQLINFIYLILNLSDIVLYLIINLFVENQNNLKTL